MSTQGYGNQETIDDTKDAKKGGGPGSASAPSPNDAPSRAADRRDKATPGDGAGPPPPEQGERGDEADPGLG